MKKVRFIRPGYFAWLVVPVAAYFAVSSFGLPHILWSYEWSNGGIGYGDIAGRHYTRCAYIGPYGIITVHPADGACDLFRLFQSRAASQAGNGGLTMELSIKDELRRTFELSALRKYAERVRTPHQWQMVKDLRARCDDVRSHVADSYHRDFAKRVEVARQRFIDEAGQRLRAFRPYGLGADRFSPSETLRLARREVRNAQQRRIERIDNFERRELGRLVENFRHENEQHAPAREAFNRAMDRRPSADQRKLHTVFDRDRS